MWFYLKKVFTNKEVKYEKGKLLSAWLSNSIIPPLTIKELVKSARIADEKILAEWDAGGDNKCINIKVGDEYDDRFFGKLCSEIVEKLQLPHDGDYYNKGCGEIDINEKGQIVLTYSTRAHYYDYNGAWTNQSAGDNLISIEWVDIEDVFQLEQYLHRVNISFLLTMGLDENKEINYTTYGELIDVRIWEGDGLDIFVPSAASEFYLKVIKDYMKKFEKEFNKIEDVSGSKEMDSIEINGTLEPGKIRLELRKTYVVIDYIIENKSVVLIY
ncbi:hypothetical protein [Xanthocytophaga agilis]|uniref:Uncharacterized protein n=1 Tax=Xanthocytophaga agilis TaxID=3048010 RepID=A0AAE3RDQ3_9BACT|nr:hypothetical protein [Xanthocytophaga agilis]MDJ1506584.1 hypothetical protein [Xanthocytophaga agilis]